MRDASRDSERRAFTERKEARMSLTRKDLAGTAVAALVVLVEY
jgi:hypothetical protein